MITQTNKQSKYPDSLNEEQFQQLTDLIKDYLEELEKRALEENRQLKLKVQELEGDKQSLANRNKELLDDLWKRRATISCLDGELSKLQSEAQSGHEYIDHLTKHEKELLESAKA